MKDEELSSDLNRVVWLQRCCSNNFSLQIGLFSALFRFKFNSANHFIELMELVFPAESADRRTQHWLFLKRCKMKCKPSLFRFKPGSNTARGTQKWQLFRLVGFRQNSRVNRTVPSRLHSFQNNSHLWEALGIYTTVEIYTTHSVRLDV